MSSYPCSIIQYLNTLLNLAHQQGLEGKALLSQFKSLEIDGILWGAIVSKAIDLRQFDVSETEITKGLKKYKIHQTAKVCYWFDSLKKVLSALDDIPHILLKGIPLSEYWYHDVLWRNTSDIDIWVPIQRRHEAIQNLKEIGYTIAEEPHLWATNQISLTCKGYVPVEIHWKLSQPPLHTPSFEHVYPRTRRYQYQDITVPVLSDGDMMIQLITHALMHEFEPRTQLDLCAGFEKLVPDTDLLKAYGLYHYYCILKTLYAPYLNSENESANHTESKLNHYISDVLLNKFFKSPQTGASNLITIKNEAICGQFKRALMMLLLDDNANRFRAFMSVIFFGPHPMGRRMMQHFGKHKK